MGFLRREQPKPIQHQHQQEPFVRQTVMAKVKMGQPGDKFEKEADATADKVVNKTSGGAENVQAMQEEEKVQQQPIASGISSVQKKDLAGDKEPVQSKAEGEKEEPVQAKEADAQRQEEGTESDLQMKEADAQRQEEGTESDLQMKEDEEPVQPKATAAPKPKSATSIESKLKSSKGGGQKLSGKAKSDMEAGFGADFSNVNIHTDGKAAEMSDQIGAQAFTHGNDVYFNQGKYDPASQQGKHLLAHELTHTIQQSGMVQKQDKIKPESSTSPSLTNEQRVELRRITGNRIDKTYTDYIDAAQQVKSQIHDAAKAQIDFVAFLADIALGIMLPGVGKALANWANKIPDTASNQAFITAYALLDQSRTTNLLVSGTKVGTQMLKNEYKNLSGLDKTDAFIEKMKQSTRNGFDRTDSNLPNLTDQELATLYLAFDTEFTNAMTYKSQISKTVERFKKQILSIGKYTSSSVTVPASTTSSTTGVMWLEYAPKKIALANINLIQTSHPTNSIQTQESTKVKFNFLIDKDMGAIAEKVGNAEQPNGVKKMTYAGIQSLKEKGLFKNYPKEFPSGKYYKTTK